MPSDAQQITNLEAELNALVSPTTAQVRALSRDYDADIVAASAARMALAGGGGGGSPAGAAVVSSYSFAFNTSVLTTGVTFYTPTIGDVLLNAWVEILNAWDGTTPRGDYGPDTGLLFGAYFGDYMDMTSAAVEVIPGGASPASSQGSARIYIETATPESL